MCNRNATRRGADSFRFGFRASIILATFACGELVEPDFTLPFVPLVSSSCPSCRCGESSIAPNAKPPEQSMDRSGGVVGFEFFSQRWQVRVGRRPCRPVRSRLRVGAFEVDAAHFIQDHRMPGVIAI